MTDNDGYNGGGGGGDFASNGDGNGTSSRLRPVFLGNITNHGYQAEDVHRIFETPMIPNGTPDGTYTKPFPVDRVDMKRGYCFVFLKDVSNDEDKSKTEQYISAINGMPVPNISPGLRSEFARGDGRVKQLEEDRRRRIQPSETLFVVNFHEETTKREDLEMLFDPFGEIVRIEMKRNYAFVQFRTIEQATRAKEAVNGGKLDQSYLTVEYVAQQRGRDGGGGGRRGGNDRRGPRDGGRRYDDRGGGRRDDRRRDDYQRDRYDDRRHDDRRSGGGGGYDDRRRQSPPRYSSYRGRSSRSRSPPRRYRSRSRSPDRYNDRGGRYDDRGGGSSGGGGGYSGGGGGGGRDRSPEPYRGRGRSPDRDRGGGGGGFDRRDRDDRGYRP